MPLHTSFEQINDVLVVGIRYERESAAIVHEFLELGRLVETEFIDSNFLLLALDVIIFLVFRASRKSLPWQLSTQEIEKDVTNSF